MHHPHYTKQTIRRVSSQDILINSDYINIIMYYYYFIVFIFTTRITISVLSTCIFSFCKNLFPLQFGLCISHFNIFFKYGSTGCSQKDLFCFIIHGTKENSFIGGNPSVLKLMRRTRLYLDLESFSFKVVHGASVKYPNRNVLTILSAEKENNLN